MKIKISDIKIGDRIMNLEPRIVSDLKESIRANGMLNPIIITEDKTLVGGLHRLMAMKELGYDEIETTYLNQDNFIVAEIDENIVRKDIHFLEKAEQIVLKAYFNYLKDIKGEEYVNNLFKNGLIMGPSMNELLTLVKADTSIDKSYFGTTPKQSVFRYRNYTHRLSKQIRNLAVTMNATTAMIDRLIKELPSYEDQAELYVQLKKIFKDDMQKGNGQGQYEFENALEYTINMRRREEEELRNKKINQEREKLETDKLKSMTVDDKIDFVIDKKIDEERKNYLYTKNTLPPTGYIEKLVKDQVKNIKSTVNDKEEVINRIESIQEPFRKDNLQPIKFVEQQIQEQPKLIKRTHIVIEYKSWQLIDLVQIADKTFFVNDLEEANGQHAINLMDKYESVLFVCRTYELVEFMKKIIKSLKGE